MGHTSDGSSDGFWIAHPCHEAAKDYGFCAMGRDIASSPHESSQALLLPRSVQPATIRVRYNPLRHR
jgi:hypothetical protein